MAIITVTLVENRSGCVCHLGQQPTVAIPADAVPRFALTRRMQSQIVRALVEIYNRDIPVNIINHHSSVSISTKIIKPCGTSSLHCTILCPRSAPRAATSSSSARTPGPRRHSTARLSSTVPRCQCHRVRSSWRTRASWDTAQAMGHRVVLHAFIKFSSNELLQGIRVSMLVQVTHSCDQNYGQMLVMAGHCRGL